MGGAAGSRETDKAETPEVRFTRLNDFRMEHIMLGGSESLGSGAAATGLPRWRQQVQYAIGHTLNDFYSLQPAVRRETPIQFLLERRWPPKSSAFPSLMHYWDVKTAVGDELMRLAPVNHTGEIPVMLYEQWHTQVPELSVELAMIFQLAWNSERSGRCLNIQKFMVSGHEDVITGFLHMANVFCHKAYGMPADTIEIYSLMDGRRHIFDGAGIPLTESLDYVRLLSVFLNQDHTADRNVSVASRRNEKSETAYGGFGLM
ncbi:hypothetical protein [Paenibacillus sp. FSL R7-0273]|uniref:hypothetical protein n=1 Tax=Paenibacillus sp. FSL R7-0273 TaxID=1536772 RepID=UPI000693A05B|nr:hypothetical protein [Paenibacillus sp. FSL R7-0273]OMF85207.1 hypothetical protein BK144_28495 [Paenibacillus sp. FSL R7-0273]